MVKSEYKRAFPVCCFILAAVLVSYKKVGATIWIVFGIAQLIRVSPVRPWLKNLFSAALLVLGILWMFLAPDSWRALILGEWYLK